MFSSDEAVRNDWRVDDADASVVQLAALAARVASLEAARVVDLTEQLESLTAQIADLNVIISNLLNPPPSE
jgi:hypothetical protein